jgi:hypothetical protein
MYSRPYQVAVTLYRASSEQVAGRPLSLMHSRNRHGSMKLPAHIGLT